MQILFRREDNSGDIEKLLCIVSSNYIKRR